MLEIINAKKYFNKGKNNQIKAIDDTTLSFEDNGLVALLGPSGCGKTTLLNAIGGLDKLKSGKIYINGEKVNSKLVYRRDKIRNLNVGYIFQDYKLIENMSVYDNVAIVLRMLGLKDKKIIKERVEYSLEKVGMLRYKRRPAAMLSGGERQRVGIARAIVKDPNIILADEPTGNLDSKNSLEVMKIIKGISKDRLVILVTHEVNLAKFYASRIIEIKDGKVEKDYKNKTSEDLDYRTDNTFYLKDFDNVHELKDKDMKVNIYTNNKEKININVVIDNGNIYIETKNDLKPSIVDETTAIEFVNDHYKKITKDEVDKYNFDFNEAFKTKFKKKYTSILNPITLKINGFKKVFDYSILKKVLLGGFILSGMFLLFAVSSIAGALKVSDEDFIAYNKEYLITTQKKNTDEDFWSIGSLEGIDYLLPGSSLVNLNIDIDELYQSRETAFTVSGSLSDINMITKEDLVMGRMPENENEIVMDLLVIKRSLKTSEEAKMLGFTKPEELLNRDVKVKHMENMKIVGYTDKVEPNVYVNRSRFINIIANSSSDGSGYANIFEYSSSDLIDYTLYQNKITLKKGSWPVNDYEVIVNYDNESTMPLNKTIDTKVNGHNLKVVGYYTSVDGYTYYLTNQNTLTYSLISTKEDITILSKNREKTLSELKARSMNVQDTYKKSKADYERSIKESVRSKLLVAEIILAISLIEVFLMIRSSFLSRVKEVGIFRAIGVKKADIYKMFFGEIIAMTTLASVPGILFMTYILYTLSQSPVLTFFSKEYVINPYIVLITIALIYGFNLVVGLLPVFNTLRKTPAAILSRHDLD